MSKLIGHFYLRLTANGNLTGEFSNNHSHSPQAEAADRIGQTPSCLSSPDAFVGQYLSTWHETTGRESQAISAVLEIIRHEKHVHSFQLTWTNQPGGKQLFKGNGFIGEGLLIGSYEQAE